MNSIQCDRCINQAHEGNGAWLGANWWRCMPCLLRELEAGLKLKVETLSSYIDHNRDHLGDLHWEEEQLAQAEQDLARVQAHIGKTTYQDPLGDLIKAVQGYRNTLDGDRKARHAWDNRVAEAADRFVKGLSNSVVLSRGWPHATD